MADETVPMDVPTVEYNTVELPPSIEIKESSVRTGEAGAFAKELIPRDTRFGPYKGEIINAGVKKYIDYRFAWEVFEKNSNVLRHTICAMDSKLANWMRNVNCARFYEEQNILSVQDGFSIFYVAMKDIKPGEELLTWFDPKLIKRTKRRLSKMRRKPVGYTIELVPWSDEKKFVPEIIDTKRARKKKVLSDMISLDEDPLAITRTLQRLPKLPCTPKQLAQSATYRQLFASIIQKAESSPASASKKLPSKAKSSKSTKSAPVVVYNKHNKSSPKATKCSDSTATWKDVKSVEGASCLNKIMDSGKMKSLTKSQSIDEMKFSPNKVASDMKSNVLKPKKLKKRVKDNNRIALSEIVAPKPIVFKSNEDGSLLVEDHDETFVLKNMELLLECDELCPCLDKKQPQQSLPQSHPGGDSPFVIHFTLLPEHRTLSPDNKVMYKCDICGSAYNHAFSLKRHYLGIHINHRYLTQSDIESCQIETFHIGTQVEICRPNIPQLSPCDIESKNQNILQSLGTTVDGGVNSCPATQNSHNVQSLLQLAKSAVENNNKNSSVSCANARQNGVCTGTGLPPISIEIEKNENPSMSEVSEEVFDLFNNHPFNLCSDLTGKLDTGICLVNSSENKLETPASQGITSSSSSQQECPVTSIMDSNVPSQCLVDIDSEVNDSSNSSQQECPVTSIMDSNVLSQCLVDIGSEVNDSSNSYHVAHAGKEDDLSVCVNMEHHGTPSLNADCEKRYILSTDSTDRFVSAPCLSPASAVVGVDGISLHPDSDASFLSQSHLKTLQALPNSSETDSLVEVKSHLCSTDGAENTREKTSTESLHQEENIGCDNNESYNILVPDSQAESHCEMPSAEVENSHQESIIKSSTPGEIETGTPDDKSETSVDVKSLISGSIHSDIVGDLDGKTDRTLISESTYQTLEMNHSEMSDNVLTAGSPKTPTADIVSKGCVQSCNTSTLLAAPSPELISSSSFKISKSPSVTPSTNLESISSASAMPSSIPELMKSSSTTSNIPAGDTALVVSSKNSSPPTPQVIFVTNIVFPLVSPPQKTAATSSQNLAAHTSVVTTTGVAKTLPASSQATGLPLVLISQLPAGINSASAFLQSPTALKTIQTLQNSLMSLGNNSAITRMKGNVPSACPVSVSAVSTKTLITEGTVTMQVRPPLTQTSAPVTSLNSQQAGASSPSLTSSHCGENVAAQPEDLYRCHMCVLVFKTMSQLKNHIKNDPHRFKGCIKQYACFQCSMRFSNKMNLIRHNLMNHQKEDENLKFRCYTCGKGFSTETYLKMHARFHSGKNFPCKYGCVDVYFPNAASLVKHLRAQHAGLDLKEYLKNVKPKHRKEIYQAEASSSQLKELKAQSRDKLCNQNNPLPYSMMQPGIGFQAKRMKPDKHWKETVEKSTKSDQYTEDTEFNEIQLSDVKTEEDDVSQEEIKKLLFACKLCRKGFSTHLKLLQHRTQVHGAPQSVQEYLYEMSKDVYEDENSEQESIKSEEFSPPASPKTFFSNINRKGYENMKYYIDGNMESLRSWSKYVRVEDYISITEPALPPENSESKLEWTFYNFPPSFVYKRDCTEFYEVGAPEVKSEKFLSGNSQACDDGRSEKPTEVKPEVEDGSFSAVSDCVMAQSDSDSPMLTVIKTEVEDDSSCDNTATVREVSHLQENDLCCEEQTCKSQCTSPIQEFSNQVSKGLIPDKEPHKSGSDQSLPDLSVIEDSVQNKLKEVTICRLDSGVGLMSTSDFFNCNESFVNDPLTIDLVKGTADVNRESKELNELNMSSCGLNFKTSSPANNSKKEYVLPDFPLKEKLEVLYSSFMQSINLESKSSQCVNKVSLSSSRDILALNLHTTGSQLSSSQIMQKYQSSCNHPFVTNKRQRTLSLPSLTHTVRVLPTFESSMDTSLNISDASKHDHRRYSIWSGQMHQKVMKEAGDNTFCCPVVETVKKQETLRLREQYLYDKASREKEIDGEQRKTDLEKEEFASVMGLMPRNEFEISPHAKKLEEHIIKPPEVWKNYENIWFGKKGTVTVVCSICHRHFSYWDLCLRHQLKKHPHIEPSSIEMERDNDVEDLYYYYPMRYGILAQTQLVPDNLPPLEVYVCTRCGFPFKNLNKLHSHIIACDPAMEMSTYTLFTKSSNTKKKLLPIMDRRLTQEQEPPPKNKLGKNHKVFSNSYDKNNKKGFLQSSLGKSSTQLPSSKSNSNSNYLNSLSHSSYYSFGVGAKQKNYDLPYNPQNHTRRRESYKVLDQHQCHGCNLKFNSLSMLERHVKKCSGREKLQSQKPLVSQIIPDDAAVRKQHTCRYCNKRFTYIKGVELHYKRICSVRKVKEEENQLTEEDLAHEEELKRIIEHLKWSKTLNKDSSDIIQGHVRVEEDGTLTRVVKERGCPKGVKKKDKKKSSKSASSTKSTYDEDSSITLCPSGSSHNSSISDSKSTDIIEPAESSELPCKRLTRSLSMEKASSASDSSGKRKSSSSCTDQVSSKKNIKSSHSASSSKDNVHRGKAGIKSKKKTTSKVKKSNMKKGSLTNECTIRLPARKRGRPQKFDPSDMESSYKKKKKYEAPQKQTKEEGSRNNIESSRPSSKSAYFNKKVSIAPAISESSKNQNKSFTTRKELTLAESSKLMEKMKQLKEKAKLENDNQSKLKKAKQAKKMAEKKAPKSETDLSDTIANKLCGKTQPSELFKQLTKNEAKVMPVKQLSPDSSFSSPSSCKISTLNCLKRKNPGIILDVSPTKKFNSTSSPGQTSLHVSVCQNISKTSSTTSVSKITTLTKTKSFDEKSSTVAVDESFPGSPKSQTSSTQPLKITTLSSKLTSRVEGSSKSQPVSVRVVTLSPNGMNLLTFESPSDVPVKTASSACSSLPAVKSAELSPAVPTKVLKTSLETLQFARKSPGPLVIAADNKVQESNKIPVTNFIISNPSHNIHSPVTTTCIKIKKAPSNIAVKTMDEVSNFNQDNELASTSDQSLSATPKLLLETVSDTSEDVGHSQMVITRVENSPGSTMLYSVAKTQGYSVLKTPIGSVPQSSTGTCVTQVAASSKRCQTLAANQIIINSQKPNIFKLTSPVTKVQLSGDTDGISGGLTQCQTVKLGSRSVVSKVGDKVHLISPSKLITPTNIVLSPGSNANSSVIVSSSSTLIIPPSAVKSSRPTSTIPNLVTGTKLRMPLSRFVCPRPASVSNVIHGNVAPPGGRVLKIGNSLVSPTLDPSSGETLHALHLNSNVSSIAMAGIPEKNVLISTVSLPRKAVSQPRLQLASQTTRMPGQQIITLGTNSFPNRKQPTVIVQHAASAPLVSNQQAVHNNSTTGRTLQVPVDGSNKYVVPERSFRKQPSMIHQPKSLLTNQIMISLDDGTTAMLDPDSLAQFLSLSPSLNKSDMDSEVPTMVTDPEHVMVNMAEIQPSHQEFTFCQLTNIT
ncbi:hypothetical protein Btru_049695 [Bulinus truncatus]|nr:hypothetical protein Btru_049695 [Bulinus truncatus]